LHDVPPSADRRIGKVHHAIESSQPIAVGCFSGTVGDSLAARCDPHRSGKACENGKQRSGERVQAKRTGHSDLLSQRPSRCVRKRIGTQWFRTGYPRCERGSEQAGRTSRKRPQLRSNCALGTYLPVGRFPASPAKGHQWTISGQFNAHSNWRGVARALPLRRSGRG